MLVTKELLEKHEACWDHVSIFAEEWPDGVTITLKSARRAIKIGLDLDWFAATCLPTKAQKVYDAARDEAWKVYYAAIDEAQKVYDAAIDEALVAAVAGI